LRRQVASALAKRQTVGSTYRKLIIQTARPVFQDPYFSLNPRKTIRMIIELPLIAAGKIRKADRRHAVRDMIDWVGLPERVLEGYPSELSGGQRQRVTIARALITNPRLVICDEPTSALEISVQAQILSLLRDLQKGLGLSHLLISHNLDVVEYMPAESPVMQNGSIVESFDGIQLFHSPQHPYTQRLLASILPVRPPRRLPEK